MLKTKRTVKVKPMLQKHEGCKTIKRFGIELKYDYSRPMTMIYFKIGFMNSYYYVGIFIRKYRRIKKNV